MTLLLLQAKENEESIKRKDFRIYLLLIVTKLYLYFELGTSLCCNNQTTIFTIGTVITML